MSLPVDLCDGKGMVATSTNLTATINTTTIILPTYRTAATYHPLVGFEVAIIAMIEVAPQ